MIGINNLTTSSINEEFIKKITERVLQGELGLSEYGNIELSIVFVGRRRMRELNKKYRKKNRVTDVLAFGGNKILSLSKTSSFWDDEEKFRIPEPAKELGELVICLKEVKKNAKRYGLSFSKELSLVLIHGILHLLGYEHEKSKIGADNMREKEEYYLSQIETELN